MPYGIEVINKAGDEADVTIYGYIADEKWYDEDVTPKDFKETMDKLKGMKKVNVLINSGGGGVFAGHAIYNIIKAHPAETVGHVQGIAASIASVILQGCKTRIVPKNGMVMIHNPATWVAGDAAEMRKTADFLDKIKDSIVATYADRTKVNEKEIRAMMDDETWMTGEDAVVFGFADELDEKSAVNSVFQDGRPVINGQAIDPKLYRAFPAQLVKNETPAPVLDTSKELEVYEMELQNLSHLAGVTL